MQLTDDVFRVKSGSGVASPTSVLVEEELMASWPWEAKPPHSRQGSPLYEGASQAAMRTETRPTLVETLQTCLTSLPHTTMATATSGGQSVMAQLGSGGEGGNVETVATNSIAFSRNIQNMTNAPKSAGAGGAKVGKRRSRASRRVPTTVFEASSSDFRDMVQKLTGIPLPGSSKSDPGSQVVRPQPKRPVAGLGRVESSETPPKQPTPPQFSHPLHQSINWSPQFPDMDLFQQFQQSTGQQFPFSCKPEGRFEAEVPISHPYHTEELTRTQSPGPSTHVPDGSLLSSLWEGVGSERQRDFGYNLGSRHQQPETITQYSAAMEPQPLQASQDDQISNSQIDSWFPGPEMRV